MRVYIYDDEGKVKFSIDDHQSTYDDVHFNNDEGLPWGVVVGSDGSLRFTTLDQIAECPSVYSAAKLKGN